jgi:hypothetical protein
MQNIDNVCADYKMIIDDAGMAGWRSSLAALFSIGRERLV